MIEAFFYCPGVVEMAYGKMVDSKKGKKSIY